MEHYKYIYIYIYIFIYLIIYIIIYIVIYFNAYTYTYTFSFAYTYLFTYVYIVFTDMHIHIYIYNHVCIISQPLFLSSSADVSEPGRLYPRFAQDLVLLRSHGQLLSGRTLGCSLRLAMILWEHRYNHMYISYLENVNHM